MFSRSDRPRDCISAPSWGASSGPWPVGVRGLLTVLGMLAALGLRMADRGVGPGSRVACKPAPVLVLDPNTAPPAVLGALPHVGPSLVKKLVEQRELRPFASIRTCAAACEGWVRPRWPGLLPICASHPDGTSSPAHRIL